jgi:hypothetical protein
MSEHTEEPDQSIHAVDDEDLPEDLQPTDDNPLAKPLSDDPDEGGIDATGEGMPDMGEPGAV